MKTLAAVSCSPTGPGLGGVGLGLDWGLGQRASRAVHGAVHGWCMAWCMDDIVYTCNYHTPTTPPPTPKPLDNHAQPPMHHPCTTPCNNHAPHHARPYLPVVPDPNLTPPNPGPVALHDTAAIFCANYGPIHFLVVTSHLEVLLEPQSRYAA